MLMERNYRYYYDWMATERIVGVAYILYIFMFELERKFETKLTDSALGGSGVTAHS